MDFQTTSPGPPEFLATMLQQINIDKEERNSTRDTIKSVMNNYSFTEEDGNLVLESSDIFYCLRNAVPPFLAHVRKIDQSRSTVGKTTGTDNSDPILQAVTTNHEPHSSILKEQGRRVDIIEVVSPTSSSLSVAGIADLYARSMLKCLAGYPLYEPQPFSELSAEYLRYGVNVGDVGFVRGDGTFDFLFNICPFQNALVNPPVLPHGFSLEPSDCSATRVMKPLPRETCLYQGPITRTKSGEYICEGSEGAILELPEGAIQAEVTNMRPFAKLAACHGVQWYEYAMTRGRDISNGSLYLITSFTKCAQWGTAVFDRPCAPGQGLKFNKKIPLPFGKSTSKYHWKGSHTLPTKVSNVNKGDIPNQCLFLRGYKIMIRQDIFDHICHDRAHGSNLAMPSTSPQAGCSSPTRQRAHRIRGGGTTDPMPKTPIGGLFSRTTMSNKKSDKFVLHPNFNSSLAHPADLVNAMLLSQNPDAKVALTHDDVWFDLLRDNFPKLNYATLIDMARFYITTIDKYECVSLEKISDSSGVLDEASRLLQETPSLTLIEQGLTISEEDYAPVPVQISWIHALPHELVERILLLLDAKSMLICKLVNKEFNEIIQSSTLLQYFLTCKAAGVIDNPRSSLSYAERLRMLEKREAAWRKLKPLFETSIKVNHQPSSIYGLTEGAYFLGDNNLRDLHCCHLPSSLQDDLRWIKIPGHGPRQGWPGIFVNFGIAGYEHDLIVNAISSPVENQDNIQQHSLDLILLRFSTGEYHSLARQPRIHVQKSASVQPFILISIVGDNLAMVVNNRDGTSPDYLFIFDWKTGHKRLQHEAIEDSYSELVFISPELLLVPNLIRSQFEIWHLPPFQTANPKSPCQILSLKIPSVSDDCSLLTLGCCGEPNLFLHSLPYFPPRPFLTSPDDSVISANLYLDSLQGLRAYILIVHRRALLDVILKWTSPSFLEQQQDLLTWLTNEVTKHNKLVDLDDGSVQPGAYSKLVSQDLHSSEHPPQTHESSESSANVSRYNVPQVNWGDWGPPISRWFKENETQARWIMSSTGQRYAVTVPSPQDRRKLTIRIADFNPYNCKWNSRNEEENVEEEVGEELELLDHEGVFAGEVYMGLKCVVYHVSNEYDFDAVLMDEQRLLGLKLNRESKDESEVKILYFG